MTFTPAAAKALMALPSKDAQALRNKLVTVAEAPFAAHAWAKRLTGSAYYRARQGDWRAVYRIDTKAGLVEVIKIANRREIYG